MFTPEQLADRDVALGKELFGPIMHVLITLSYFIGILVIGLIIYSDVSGRRRSFGVMKALGFRLPAIARGIIMQNGLLLLLAYPIGVALAYTVARGIEWKMPVYLVYVTDPSGLVTVLLGVICMMLLGSLLPLRLVAQTDPMLAFQEE